MNTNHFEEDLQFIFDKILTAHIMPNYRLSMEQLKLEMELSKLKVKSCNTTKDFWQIVQQFLTIFGDAHTYLKAENFEHIGQIPVKTRYIDGLVVISEVSDYVNTSPAETFDLDKIKIGDVILYVNGKEVEQLIAEQVKEIPSNSLEWAKRIAAKNILNVDTLDPLEVVLSKDDGETYKAILPVLPIDDARTQKHMRKERLTRCIEVNYLEKPRAGYLAIRMCFDRSVYDSANVKPLRELDIELNDIPDLEEICWSLFQELERRNYKNLIIDLRGNMGGNSKIPQILYKYITSNNLTTYRGLVKISLDSKKISEFENEEIGTILTDNDCTLHYPYYSRLAEKQLPEVKTFQGNIFVLIDQEVFSSGEWIAAELRANNLGLFIGEPTGGGGSVPGDCLTFVLPNTGFNLLLSYKMCLSPLEDSGIPAVLPDYYVRQSLSDFRVGRDTVLERVKDICNK